jgi:hypothetical protein
MKKHGIGHVNADNSHRWFLLPPSLTLPLQGGGVGGGIFYIMLYG